MLLLPKPHYDEFLPSYLARGFLLSGYLRRSDFMAAVCGRDWKLTSQSSLGAFDIRRKIGGVSVRARDVLFSLTLYPFFRPFLRGAGRQLYEERDTWTPRYRPQSGWIPDYIAAGDLRHCPECARDQISSVGYPYFVRDHNLPNVHACHWHNTVLSLGTVTLDPREGCEPFLLPDPKPGKCAPASKAEVRYSRAAAMVLASGVHVTSEDSELEGIVFGELMKLFGAQCRADLSRYTPRLIRFLRASKTRLTERLSTDGDFEDELVRLLSPHRVITTATHASLMVHLIMLLYPEDWIPGVLLAAQRRRLLQG